MLSQAAVEKAAKRFAFSIAAPASTALLPLPITHYKAGIPIFQRSLNGK
jgi:hypothetical protein